jgi:4-methyl-5(b-hydroxyethyl)-thiazole monophosphate biosynthesis
MTKQVLVPIANGSEEIEAVSIIDVLRRAGIEVTVAAVTQIQVTASRGVKLVADCLIHECIDKTFDLIAIPGGMPGAEHLRDSNELTTLLKSHFKEEKYIAAICAAPVVVLQHHGILSHKTATCHPGFQDKMKNLAVGNPNVVVDGKIITSQGPGTAIQFALKLVEVLLGKEKSNAVAAPMVI